MAPLSTSYETWTLNELADKLNTSFYQPIRELCEKAIAAPPEPGSEAAISGILALMDNKQQSLLEYLKTLAEKSNSGHDCSNCSGNCDMGHAAHLMDIKESHIAIHNHLAGIAPATMSADDIWLLKKLVACMLRIEEEILVPKIWGAQRRINAVN